MWDMTVLMLHHTWFILLWVFAGQTDSAKSGTLAIYYQLGVDGLQKFVWGTGAQWITHFFTFQEYSSLL